MARAVSNTGIRPQRSLARYAVTWEAAGLGSGLGKHSVTQDVHSSRVFVFIVCVSRVSHSIHV